MTESTASGNAYTFNLNLGWACSIASKTYTLADPMQSFVVFVKVGGHGC